MWGHYDHSDAMLCGIGIKARNRQTDLYIEEAQESVKLFRQIPVKFLIKNCM